MSDWLDETIKKAADSFDIFEKQVYERGELDPLIKEYIALACSTVLRSEDGVKHHTDQARKMGAGDEEISAALGVAWLTIGSTQIYWMQDEYEELLGKAWYKRHLPDASQAFGDFHKEIFDNSVLDRKTVELIGAGVAVVGRCEHCTEAHVKQAMNNGASKQEAAEAIGVAWHIGAESQLGWTDTLESLFSDQD